jgi:hypothetical protein
MYYSCFYAKCRQASSNYKALHTPWCHIIFGLWRVSLTEYPSYSGFIPTCCRWYHVLWLLQELLLSHYGWGVRPWAWSFYVVLPTMLLLEMILNWHVFELCVMLVSKLCCFCYIWTWGVITMLNSDVCWTNCELVVTCGNVCWIMYDLGCMLAMIQDPSWYSTDYQVYMSSSVCVSTCKRGPSWLILYKFIGSMTHLYWHSNLVSLTKSLPLISIIDSSSLWD